MVDNRGLRAIPTQYKYTLYRSRCEAKWAVFFDNIGWSHIFEPEGFDLGESLGYYLPDFWLKHPVRCLGESMGYGWWLEIKPAQATDTELSKLLAVCQATSHNGYLIQGYPDREHTVTKIQVLHRDSPEILRDFPPRWESPVYPYEFARLCAGKARFEHRLARQGEP